MLLIANGNCPPALSGLFIFCNKAKLAPSSFVLFSCSLVAEFLWKYFPLKHFFNICLNCYHCWKRIFTWFILVVSYLLFFIYLAYLLHQTILIKVAGFWPNKKRNWFFYFWMSFYQFEDTIFSYIFF